jgi:hypothetical protein
MEQKLTKDFTEAQMNHMRLYVLNHIMNLSDEGIYQVFMDYHTGCDIGAESYEENYMRDEE